MRLASTAWLYTLVLLTLPVGYAIAVVLLVVTWPFDRQRRIAHHFVATWCHLYLRSWPFWSVRVTGREHLPKGPCVLVANHQSLSDILALMGLGYAFKFVSKASLFEVPFIGWMMTWLRYVSLVRGNLPSTANMVERCGALLSAGERVLIFPEGTYAGPVRLPFKRGAFRLAQVHQVPVVPVVVRGTEQLVHEDGPWFEPRARVHIEVMAPLAPPKADESDEVMVKAVEDLYASWLKQPFKRHQSPV